MGYRIGAAARIWMGVGLLAVLPSGARADSRAQIDEGIRLHDEGKYEEAIAAFRKVLEKEPYNSEAIYEISNSLMYSGRFLECAENSRVNLDRSGKHRALFLMTWAACLDNAGDPARGAEIFDQALAEFPEFPGLAFNAGVTRLSLGQADAAKELFKREIRLRPVHPSSHYLLARSFDESGHTVPALLANLRFLSLEGAGPRAAEAAKKVIEILGRGYTKVSEKETTITLPADSPTGEGDNDPILLAIGIAAASADLEPHANQSAGERLVQQIDLVLGVLTELATEGERDFARETYLPFLRGLREAGLVEPFVYRFAAPVSEPSLAEWLAAHPDRVAALEGYLRGTAKP